jgi:predicted nuclease of predicted toxin-antitoxin system
VKIVVDAQLPPALAQWLCEAGHQAVHVEEVGLCNSSDDTLWTHALQNDAAIMTKDEDFAARSERTPSPAPLIVWLRVGNATNRALRAWIEPRLSGIVRLVGEGNRLIEVR